MIPASFDPPRTQDFGAFKLEVLAPCFADVDYAAVRASADRICDVFGPGDGWPSADITFEENLADLTRHAREFDERVAFAYALLSSDGQQYLGCLYIKPVKSKLDNDCRRDLFQAQAFLWLNVEFSSISEDLALARLQAWVAHAWPFKSVAWPGRVQTWAEWEVLADS